MTNKEKQVLETILTEKSNFFGALGKELLGCGKLYLKILRHPELLVNGTYHAVKDIFYELPKSLLGRDEEKSPEKKLNEKASQALTICEVLGVPGTYAGAALFSQMGADPYTASVVGGDLGNYIAGVAAYISSYVLLSRGNQNYSAGTALKDSFKVIKDCFPAAMALYIGNAPILSSLIATGVPPNIALGTVIAFGTVVFTGVAKHSAAEKINQNEIQTK